MKHDVPPHVGNDYSLEQYLGTTIRNLRIQNGLTIAEVADRIGISRGMVSKIENGQTSTSLDILDRFARAFGLSLSYLFRNYNVPSGNATMVPAGKGLEVMRAGTSKGHTYELLSYGQGPKKRFEPFLITMDDKSEIFPTFEHPGTEFIYMLEGLIEYRHGQSTYVLRPGDALTFDATIPHGPERLLEVPIRFLAVMVYGDEDKG